MPLALAAVEYGAGPPLAILHGLFGSGRNWTSIAQGLAPQHRVIAFDRPGFGYSERPRTTAWTPERQAEQLLRPERLALSSEDRDLLATEFRRAVHVALLIEAEPPHPAAFLVPGSDGALQTGPPIPELQFSAGEIARFFPTPPPPAPPARCRATTHHRRLSK